MWIGNNDQSQDEVAQREHDEQDDRNDASIEVVVVLVDFHRDPPFGHSGSRCGSSIVRVEEVLKKSLKIYKT
jgi:hypothetical protein